MADSKESGQLQITEGHYTRFLDSVGIKDHDRCPRCGHETWNPENHDQERVFMTIPMAHIENSELFLGHYQVGCATCGFTEDYLVRPLAEFIFKK